MLASKDAKIGVLSGLLTTTFRERLCQTELLKSLHIPYLMKSLLHIWADGQSHCKLLKLIDLKYNGRIQRNWIKVIAQVIVTIYEAKVLFSLFKELSVRQYLWWKRENIEHIIYAIDVKTGQFPSGKELKKQCTVTCQKSRRRCSRKQRIMI